MSNSTKTQPIPFRNVLTALGAALVATIGPTLLFLLLGDKVIAAICGTLTVVLVLVTSHIAAFAGGAWYTRGSMQVGAAIALKAQELDDTWDERQMNTLAKVFSQGANLGRVTTAPEIGPALPLPSQMQMADLMMPSVSMLTDGRNE